nr:metallophosphoesterase [uncultured Campylobacter sp.]
MIYFTSDLHFGHSNIVKFHPCFRPFSSVEAMDKVLIRLWNERVNPCDTVYNIGDLSFHKDMGTNISIFSKLNGKHVLVLGNHDEAIKKHKDELLAMKKQDGNALFDEICEYKEITVQHGQDKFRLVLFHYPLAELERRPPRRDPAIRPHPRKYRKYKRQGAKRQLRPARQDFEL